MIDFDYHPRLRFVRAKAVFFAPESNREHTGYDVIYYFSCQKSAPSSKKFTTLLIDLSPQPDELLHSFRKSTRKEIQSALINPQIHFEINEHPTKQQVEAYINAYDQFAEYKKIPPCNWNLLHNLLSANKLFLARALMGDQTLCQFALIDDEERACCLYGYNNRLNGLLDEEQARLVSRANRAMEYTCMLHAKEAGKKYYDLYGLTLDEKKPSASNVDQYKMGFRGQVVVEYNVVHPVTIRGRLFYLLRKLYGYYFSVKMRASGIGV